MQTPEGKVKNAAKKLLKQHDCFFYMPTQSGYGVVGIPDIVGCHKGAFFAIETKAPGKLKNLSPNQKMQLHLINESSGANFVTDGDFTDIINWLTRDVTPVTLPFWSKKIL